MIKLKQILTEKKYNFQIYCDLDGVLCNFDKRVEHITGGLTTYEFEKKKGISVWPLVNKMGVKFWSDMEWMPGGKELWMFIAPYNPIILTAYPPTIKNNAVAGKKIWIKNNIGKTEAIYTTSKEKYKYANDRSILIDDMVKNINPWIEAKGLGILHIDTHKTINDLKSLFNILKN